MQRQTQWARRLDQLISTSQAETFAWGVYDCAQFVMRAIREQTGVDIAADFRGIYSDEAGALALLGSGSATALGDFAATVAAAHGLAEITPVTFARRGDAVWVDNDTELGALGIVGLDGRHAVCMSETGTKRIHLHRWRRAWRVG